MLLSAAKVDEFDGSPSACSVIDFSAVLAVATSCRTTARSTVLSAMGPATAAAVESAESVKMVNAWTRRARSMASRRAITETPSLS